MSKRKSERNEENAGRRKKTELDGAYLLLMNIWEMGG
jgi:hypothetical protein